MVHGLLTRSVLHRKIEMAEIKDFKCTYQNSVGISPKVTEGLNLQFPDAYLHAETMAVLAKNIRTVEGVDFCELPFCHTVEAEAMGGQVNLGNERTGPRAKDYICTKPEELLALPEIDYTKGRIAEVLKACRMLKKQGEHVVLMISGPFTILNVLIDPRFVFKAMRKQPEVMQQVFDKLQEELLRFTEQAVLAKVDMISYADSSGSLNIIGPGNMEYMTRHFTWPFLKRASQITRGRTQIALCPKTAFALTGTGLAAWETLSMGEDSQNTIQYVQACMRMREQAPLTGQMCLKNTGYQVKGQLKVLRLAEEEKRNEV